MKLVLDSNDQKIIRRSIQEHRPDYPADILTQKTFDFINYLNRLSKEGRLDFEMASPIGELEYWLEEIE